MTDLWKTVRSKNGTDSLRRFHHKVVLPTFDEHKHCYVVQQTGNFCIPLIFVLLNCFKFIYFFAWINMQKDKQKSLFWCPTSSTDLIKNVSPVHSARACKFSKQRQRWYNKMMAPHFIQCFPSLCAWGDIRNPDFHSTSLRWCWITVSSSEKKKLFWQLKHLQSSISLHQNQSCQHTVSIV